MADIICKACVCSVLFKACVYLRVVSVWIHVDFDLIVLLRLSTLDLHKPSTSFAGTVCVRV